MVLITGATGHIGNVLVKKLYEVGEKIRIFVLPNEDTSIFDDMEIEIYYGDIRNYNDIREASKDVDIIYHLAAIISILPWKNDLVYSVNINGVENIIKAMKETNVKKLLYVSSVHAFAEIEKGATIDENTPIDPDLTSGAYGKSKAIATLKVFNAVKNNEINATIVCPSGVIGPYDYKFSEIGKVFKSFLEGNLKYCVDGAFDFVDVRDVANGIIKAAKYGKNGEIYILSGENITMRKIFYYLNQITQKNYKIKFINPSSAYFVSYLTLFNYLSSSRKNLSLSPYSVHTLLRYYKFSHKKAEKDFGYNPRPLYESLKDTIAWIQEYYKLSIKKEV
ncbi:NAD-dependent epimerase/dehydratase family protein [Marinitoga aeolica]|uniref:NAD-dependent epimerase/dehydratase family protein n=1 Tax=Marinitoga aeolica TaxID=2809031 RepID=A0ABY8PN37_9BACT|nr:NAD-dependent epimerase/dehydratase family protein [Marinitoga aeolica]WGS64001.1 NAD-dependent epimerase/dehydratase family protein [Marinitoga aeolica]